MTARALYDAVGAFFSEPDGTLPEICVSGIAPAELPRLAACLHSHATALVHAHTYDFTGDDFGEVAMDVTDLGTAAAEVLAGTRESFHVVLGGLVVDGVALPDLGLFVFHDELALDFDPGAAWTPEVVSALFALLRELRTIAPGIAIGADQHMTGEWRERFGDAVLRFAGRASGAASG